MEAVFGRVETIEVGGKPVSILLIKNPAGANEVLRTLLLEAASANGDGGLDLWIALNDRIADGRDVSWIWDADFELLAGHVRRVVCAGTRAAEMAVRLKYAGIAAGGDRGRGGDRPLARSRAWPRPTAGCSPFPPTRPCSSFATCSPSAAWRGGTGRELGGGLARRRVRRLRGGPRRSGSELADARPTAPCSSSGCGTGRVALHLARRGQRGLGGRRRSVPDRRARRAGGGASGLPCTPSCADVRALALDRELRADHRADAAHPDARRPATERRAALQRAAAHLAPAGRFAAAIVERRGRLADGGAAAASRRARARRLGLLEPPGRPCAPTGGGLEIRAAAPGGLPRRRAERGGAHRPPRRSGRRRARGRGAPRRASRPAGRLEIRPADGYVGLDRRRSSGGPMMELRAARALPRADEHLRRPRQHPVPAAALRVARDRLLLRRRGARRVARPRRARPDLHRRRPGPRPADRRRRHAGDQARRRSPRRSRTARSCSRSAAATSCSATATSSATSGSPGLGLADLETVREPGPRLIGNVEIEVDLGDGPAGARRLREPRRPHLPRRRRRAARPGDPGPRQQRRRRPRGRAAAEHDRHLPARPAAAQERLARRPPDPARARPAARAPSRSSRRSTTRSRPPPTSGARQAALRG